MPNTRVFVTSTLPSDTLSELLSQTQIPEGVEVTQADDSGPRAVQDAKLRALESCQAYLGILGSSYGAAQALEFWRAEEKGVPRALLVVEDSPLDAAVERFLARAQNQGGIFLRRLASQEELARAAEEFLQNFKAQPEEAPAKESAATDAAPVEEPIQPAAGESPFSPASYGAEASPFAPTAAPSEGLPLPPLEASPVVSVSAPPVEAAVSASASEMQEAPAPQAEPASPTPALPEVPGRMALVRKLFDALQPKRRVLLRGTSGVGKTVLARAVMQAAASRFPDGVLELTIGERGLTAAENLLAREVGEELGTEHNRAARQEKLKEWFSRKRALLLLDDGGDQHLWPLLSLLPEGTVLVTARELPQAFATENLQVIDVPPLTAEEGGELVQALWPGADPAGAQALSKAAGGIPLAIAIAIGQAHTMNESLSHAAQALGVERGADRLEAAARRALGYLSEEHRAIFGVMGALPSTGASPEAAAAASGLSKETAASILADLVQRKLALSPDTNRYALPEALYKLARTFPSYEGAALKVAPYYRDFADKHRDVGRSHLEAMEGERLGILAAARTMSERLKSLPVKKRGFFASLFGRKQENDERHEAAEFLVDISSAASTFLNVRGYWKEWKEMCQFGLEGARELGDERREGSLLFEMGTIARLERDFKAAHQCLNEALAKANALGEQGLKAQVLHNLALIHMDEKKPREALRLLEEAISFADPATSRTWQRLKTEIENSLK